VKALPSVQLENDGRLGAGRIGTCFRKKTKALLTLLSILRSSFLSGVVADLLVKTLII
jgi:hypothetical protein